jgi:gliding motility-associated-like protein
MKKLIFLLFILISTSAFSQLSCEIFVQDTMACYGSPFRLYTDNSPDHLFKWSPPGTLDVVPFVDIEFREKTWVYLDIYNKNDTSFVCSDSIEIDVYPYVTIELVQQNKGCPNECKAQVKASATGGFPPYKYLWAADVAPNDSSMALGLCSDDEYILVIEDTICAYDTSFLVESYYIPDIEIIMDPEDSIYNVNPQATFSYINHSNDTLPITNWVWEFSDGTSTNFETATHVFTSTETDTVYFRYTTIDGCDSSVMKFVTVKPLLLDIPNVFTPNGDGKNDRFEVPYADVYISNQIVIFNRWGEKVFEKSDYLDDWDGGQMPDGTYFYVLRCVGYFKEDVFKGSITILGSNY